MRVSKCGFFGKMRFWFMVFIEKELDTASDHIYVLPIQSQIYFFTNPKSNLFFLPIQSQIYFFTNPKSNLFLHEGLIVAYMQLKEIKFKTVKKI